MIARPFVDSSIRRFVGLTLIALILGAPSDGLAIGLIAGAQLGVSRSQVPNGGYEYWSVWAGRTDGHLVALRDAAPGQPGPVWQDYSADQIGGVGSYGVSATGWYSGVTIHERVFYAYSNNLVELEVVDRWVIGSTQFTGPAGKSLAGPIAATSRADPNGTRHPLAFATMTDGSLWVFDGSTEIWQQLAAPGTIRTSSPLAASSSADGQYARVFATTTATSSRLRSYRYSPVSGWNASSGGTDLANPGVEVCGSIAATEAQVGTGDYRVYVFCTARTAQDAKLHYRTSTAVDGTVFQAWSFKQLPVNQGNVVNTGNALAAAARAENGYSSVDAYLLSTLNRVWHAEHTSRAAALGALADLGDDGETTSRQGPLAATPAQPVAGTGGYSNVFYLGPVSGAKHLYRRKGDETLPEATRSNWAAHQSGDPRGFISSDPGGTESSTAFYRGDAANVVMRHPASGVVEAARTDVRWSADDGETWGPFQTVAPPAGYLQTADGTVDFADNHVAYVTFLTSIRSGPPGYPNNCTYPVLSQAVDYYRWTAAGPLAGPIQLDLQVPAGGTPRLDHPWVSIYRDPWGNDRKHFVWTDRSIGGAGGQTGVRYLSFAGTDYAPPGDVIGTLTNPAGGNNIQAGVPAVVTGPTGKAWVVNGLQICLINNIFTNCQVTRQFPQGLIPDSVDSIPGGDVDDRYNIPRVNPDDPQLWARFTSFHSFAPSPSNENRIYYAFQKLEQGSSQLLDLYFSPCTFNGVDTIICDGPFAIAAANASGSSQFSPELTVSQDAQGNDVILLNWYDTRTLGLAGDCTTPNRCYVPMRAVSFDGGQHFAYRQVIDIGSATISDFAELPSECSGSGEQGIPTGDRFLGDYHSVVGAPLHSFHVVVGAPDGSPAGTGTLTRHWVSGGSWYSGW